MRHRTLIFLGIGVLLFFFCSRLWSVAPTHTDDAIWRLRSLKGNWSTIHDWATSQGRVFAYVTGALIYIGCYTQESNLGPILHLGSFVIFFVAFYRVVGLFFGVRLAILGAVLNLATFALRWEGSVMTTYPIYCWALSTVFLAAIYLSRRHAQNNRPVELIGSLALLFLAMNIHESLSVLFGLLAILAVFANYDLKTVGENMWSPRTWEPKFVRHLFGTAGIVCLYFAIYVGWRLAFPSTYDGNRMGSFFPASVLPVLGSLSSTGSVISDIFRPYSVNFADAINHDGYRVYYMPLSYLRNVDLNATSLVCGAIVAFQIYALTGRRNRNGDSTDESLRGNLRQSLLVGAAIALLPILPVALVGKYQEAYFNLGVRSYQLTPFCHFGWTLILAVVLVKLFQVRHYAVRQVAGVACATMFGILSYCSTMQNDSIAADMRRETCRWRVMNQLNAILPKLDRQVAVIHAPRLASGSTFTCMTPEYWSNYMETRHGRQLRFESTRISAVAMIEGVAVVDFITARENSQTIAYAAPLDIDPATGQIVAREIAVAIQSADASDLVQFILSYEVLGGGVVVRRLSSLTKVDKSGVYIERKCLAIPSSIRLSRASSIQHVNIDGRERVKHGIPVWFGFEGNLQGAGVVSNWLTGNWHPTEVSGTWSKAKESEVRIPVAHLPRQGLKCKMHISTFTGLGFHNKPQELMVKIGDRIAATRTFSREDGWGDVAFEVHSGEVPTRGELVIQLVLDEVFNPAQLGISGDTRNLGVMLKKLTIEPVHGP